MNNKIFLKIGAVLVSIILIYILFTTFVISPKISTYLIDLETKQAKTQLDRISAIVDSKEEYLKDFKKARTAEHKDEIRNISLIAYNIINNYYQMYKSGAITREEAIKYFFETVSQIEYGHEDDYIFILDEKGKLVFHPDKKFNKKNIYYTADANGKLFVGELIHNSMKNSETFTRYSWSKLNSNFISEKIVHSVYFEPLGFIISSGVYIENIKQELEKEKKKVILELSPLIKSIILGEMGYIFILNGKDELLIHQDKNLVGKNVSNIKEQGTDKFIVDSLKSAYKNKKSWNYKWNKPDDLKNYSYEKIAWINHNDFFDWYIVSSIYKKDLELKSQEINGMIINVSLLILIILIFIAMLFIKKLLKPITILSKNANLVKEGNFEVRNNIDTNDELGLLGNQFDKMLDYIEKNTRDLEYKVEARTAEIKHKLYYDELTGLKNRESLRLDLEKEEFTALSLIDIEGFDDINELYGFDVGNEILIKVMKMLKGFSSVNNQSLYRLNSDVFAILDTNITSFMSYDKVLEEIQEIFKQEIHIDSLDIDIYLYVTIGTSISQSDSIKSANIALKKAKQSSVKYTVYNKEIDTKDNIKKTMYWREKIKTAIEEDKIIPFYQAIYNNKDEIIKYEALMRILDEVDGKPYYLSPGTFFEVAIKTKQYFKLNQLVIEKSFRNIDKLGKDLSINISFADVLNLEFIEFIDKEIKKLTKNQREKVVFEILESDFVSDYEMLDNFIFEYREKGIRIAIDDFGTGFSNFSHILKIKPDYIKIDGSLIKEIDIDPNSYEMVKSIVNFSKSLGITTIAEFIHSKEVYEIVKELEIDEFQGYYLGEPEPLIK
ncbi:EAL domain-containing protein [Arcobacter sp. LA11]|uniref:EAL domain-containing protein n=1 Tax=Arcobacter sp. LA11 TaxID=1898176 RepID=UPI0009F8C6B2|nr:EAL domain-containing protein [Arcobacter sp. LA11]